MPYCRNCGKEIASEAVFCPDCGVPPPKGSDYCPNCGNQVSPLAEVCVKCSARLVEEPKKVKSKSTSILLAILFGFFTWLYTYKKDKIKFWIGLGVSLVLSVTSIYIMVSAFTSLYPGIIDPTGSITSSLYPATGTSLVTSFVLLTVATALWLWAIVDTIVKNSDWYNKY